MAVLPDPRRTTTLSLAPTMRASSLLFPQAEPAEDLLQQVRGEILAGDPAQRPAAMRMSSHTSSSSSPLATLFMAAAVLPTAWLHESPLPFARKNRFLEVKPPPACDDVLDGRPQIIHPLPGQSGYRAHPQPPRGFARVPGGGHLRFLQMRPQVQPRLPLGPRQDPVCFRRSPSAPCLAPFSNSRSATSREPVRSNTASTISACSIAFTERSTPSRST